METTPALRKNHRALRRMLICIGAAAILIGALFTWLGANMRSAMTALATARIRSVAAKAMNDAILDTMQQDENYTELLHIRENGSKVYMVQADPRQMNLLSAQCAEAAQQRIAALGEQGIAIPLGTITGISFLSGKGAGHSCFIHACRQRAEPVFIGIHLLRHKPNALPCKYKAHGEHTACYARHI